MSGKDVIALAIPNVSGKGVIVLAIPNVSGRGVIIVLDIPMCQVKVSLYWIFPCIR